MRPISPISQPGTRNVELVPTQEIAGSVGKGWVRYTHRLELPLPDPEWLNRKRRIDPRLKKWGWTIVAYDSSKPISAYDRCAVEEWPTENGPADYALIVGGNILGIVEAKKMTIGPQNVLTQAERYSQGAVDNPLNYRGYRVPFLYSTNGEKVWFHDIRHALNLSRTVADFHSPDALAEMFARDSESDREKLLELPNEHTRLRPYQVQANAAVEQAIAERKRQMLVAMATGTGKTFTMVNQVYRLMKSGAAKRILFLVDRRALAAQAVQAFASFEPEPGHKFDQIYEVYSQRFFADDFEGDDKFDSNVLPTPYLTNPKPGNAFVYVCTIQRMMINLFGRNIIPVTGDEPVDPDADAVSIPIHAFDVVIADECHRGYTAAELSVWRKTLDHFDAVKVGLTATPAAHTTAYFNDVVFRYEYDRAVREGFLVDYDVVKVTSDVRMNGVFLKEGEQVGFKDPETGAEQMDLLEDERKFEAVDVEDKVTSPDSNRKVLEEIRKYALEHEKEFGRLPKTLIFAANDLNNTSHADSLATIAREIYGQGEAFVQKITGKVDRPLQRIREFRNRPDPNIAITVDLLSTGVDIPDLEFIVFLRQVRSRILFEQMLGRGTRKGGRFPDKSHFTVFDCFDGTLLEFFRQATAMTADPPEVELKSIVEIIEDIWQNKDRDYNVKRLVKRLQRIDKQMSGKARDDFARFIPQGDMAHYAAEVPAKLKANFTGAMSLLRNPDFQWLLMNYERAPRTFVVAYDSEDEVTSEWLARGADGKQYKPEDYLLAFARFVQENADQIDAIKILLDRPQDWGTEALRELRETLKAAPQGFTVTELQKAHKLRYDKALVEIISMVKHAAREQEQLLTAEERVSHALATLTQGKQFTHAQQQWLDRIRKHLIENLSIDREDFETVPVLADLGGWGRANRDFGGNLDEIVRQINGAIAT